jgi:DNA polymerase-3 subunit gamma/tau
MDNFVVSARKYRPVNFETVVGQTVVTSTLKSAIKTGQTAHAYLFCGPRGVGKTTCARIFAKTLNCFNLSDNTEACEICESCRSFNESRSFNIHELDAASNNSVDDIRSLIDKVRILPQVGKYSIYIIDEVHMLSQSAFNAFLKTLEEPPPHAVFILATTEKHKIIPTILSRCQIFDFHRIRVDDIVSYLTRVARLEDISFEEEALNVIALKADGAMRDALSIFDQVASFSGRKINYQEVLENLNVLDYEYYFRITESFLKASTSGSLLIFNEILQKGFDGQNFISGLASHFRDLLVCHDESTLQLLEVTDALKKRYRQQSLECEDDFLFPALEICSQCEFGFKASRNQRLHVELALIRLANLKSEKKKVIPDKNSLVIPELTRQAESKKTLPLPDLKESHPIKAPNVIMESEQSYGPIKRISIKEELQHAKNQPQDPEIEAEEGAGANNPVSSVKIAGKPLSEEFLLLCWNSFAHQLREDKPRMAVALKNVQPKISDLATINIELNNRDQLDDFNKTTRFELEKFLQREMQNSNIMVTATLIEPYEESKARLYTNEEKFRYLCQKNPLLLTLQKKLSLELE